jgi:hypothetical protein
MLITRSSPRTQKLSSPTSYSNQPQNQPGHHISHLAVIATSYSNQPQDQPLPSYNISKSQKKLSKSQKIFQNLKILQDLKTSHSFTHISQLIRFNLTNLQKTFNNKRKKIKKQQNITKQFHPPSRKQQQPLKTHTPYKS